MGLINFDLEYAPLRKQVIERYFSKYNDMQRTAILKTEGPLLIIAGAGSGKTTVVINRIAHLLLFGNAYSVDSAPDSISEEDFKMLNDYLEYMNSPEYEFSRNEQIENLCCANKVYPSEILAITFTNKAARELRDRLTQYIGDYSRDVWAYTFHAACIKILRSCCYVLGYKSNFTIYDDSDKKKVLKEIIRSLNLDDKIYQEGMISDKISKAKSRLKEPGEITNEIIGLHESSTPIDKIAMIYEEYNKYLKRSNAMDFDDIIFLTVKLLRENAEVLEGYQTKFKYIFVDEYQDTNYAQYTLVRLLSGARQNICVVGDDDQSIYKFRGANIKNILNFDSDYPTCTVIKLEQNYRSNKNILEVANSVIKHNSDRHQKKLWTDNDEGEKLKLHKSDTQDGEAKYISQKISELAGKGIKFKDIAILYRNNAISQNIEKRLRLDSIPYKIVRGTSFFQRAEVKDIMSYLNVIYNPYDEDRIKRIINVPSRKIGNKTLNDINAISSKEDIAFFDVLKNADKHPSLSKSYSAINGFVTLITALQEDVENMPLYDFFDELLQKTGYLENIREKDAMAFDEKERNILEIKSIIKILMEENSELTLYEFLEHVALFSDFSEDEGGDDSVTLMTMHASKGLEFDYVFICAMENGIFPMDKGDIEDKEEERRLCYVAITRAKKGIFFTCAQGRTLYGKTTHANLSSFCYEMPIDCIDSNVNLSKNVIKDAENIRDSKRVSNNYSQVGSSYISNRDRVKDVCLDDVFQQGEKVCHTSFGDGVIVSCKLMGNDALLEILFDSHGPKKLMYKTAIKFMNRV